MNMMVEEALQEKKALDPEKKIVFLIGDSIRMGYCDTVRRELADAAEVVFPEENCRFSQYILVCLRQWAAMCDREKVALVHFNSGHWDVGHWNEEDVSLNSTEIYGQNIRRIIDRLHYWFPNAKLIYATTTPMNPNGTNSPNFRTTQEIEVYNAVGRAAAEECGVEINDLYAFTKDWSEKRYQDYCHYTQEGFERLGQQVASVLRSRL